MKFSQLTSLTTLPEPMLRLGGALVLGGVLCFVGACSDPQKSAVEALEEKHYDLTTNDFLMAAEAGDLEAVRLFREAGQDVNAADDTGETALMRAAAGGRVELVDILLAGGADPRAKNAAGRTALMGAAESGQASIVETLLGRGAERDAADAEGWTALRLAAFEGRAGVLKILGKTADQASLDQALLLASVKGQPEAMEALLVEGAYVNARSPENLTPLMIAAQAGHTDAVKALIRHQANPYALDDSENTAANLAEAAGHLELRDWLLDPTALLEVAEAEPAPGVADPTLNPEKTEEEVMKSLGALVDAGTGPEKAGSAGQASVSSTGSEVTGAASASATSAAGDTGTTGTAAPASAVAAANGAASGGPETTSQESATAPGTQGASQSPAGPSVAMNRTLPKAGEKPLAPIRGQVIEAPAGGTDAKTTAVAQMRMQSYREAPLPVMLKGVEAATGTARMRVFTKPGQEPVEVKQGETIPGTIYRVANLNEKFISSKMGKGQMVDVSQVTVEDTRTGARHLLVKDVPGRSSDTYATVLLPGSPFEYVVKQGDVFRARTAGGGEQDYEVLDVRPTQVVIRDTASDEVMTVNRSGIAMR